MKYRELLVQSEKYLAATEDKSVYKTIDDLFINGGHWMQERLEEWNGPVHADAPSFRFYGYLKYIVCAFITLLSAIVLYLVNPWLALLAFLVFYWAEVHFLFLFPLLIDGVKDPVIASLKATYRIGIINAMITVMPISLYMIIGLFNWKAPSRNWYRGCMAILIWYQHEIRGRV